jgi:hypothetical protein
MFLAILSCRGTEVRSFAVLALAGAVFGLLIPPQAQSFTYGRLLAGSVKASVAYDSGSSSWCLVHHGGSLFQINQGTTKAVISFDEIIYYDSSLNTYYSLDGQDILTFTSSSGGTIHFKQRGIYPASVNSPSFTNFAQTYNASTDQLTVSLSVAFPKCTLPLVAVYDAP